MEQRWAFGYTQMLVPKLSTERWLNTHTGNLSKEGWIWHFGMTNSYWLHYFKKACMIGTKGRSES